jgi:hypothetical protein
MNAHLKAAILMLVYKLSLHQFVNRGEIILLLSVLISHLNRSSSDGLLDLE